MCLRVHVRERARTTDSTSLSAAQTVDLAWKFNRATSERILYSQPEQNVRIGTRTNALRDSLDRNANGRSSVRPSLVPCLVDRLWDTSSRFECYSHCASCSKHNAYGSRRPLIVTTNRIIYPPAAILCQKVLLGLTSRIRIVEFRIQLDLEDSWSLCYFTLLTDRNSTTLGVKLHRS